MTHRLRFSAILVLLSGHFSCSTSNRPPMSNLPSLVIITDPAAFLSAFEDISIALPSVTVSLLYAHRNNFVQKQLYPNSARCYAHKELVARLRKAQDACRKLGLSLKITDAYRPYRYQQVLFDVVPNKQYVADPKRGSNHNRGMAIDVTLIDRQGKELDMGGAIDEMSENAHRSYTGIPLEAYKNRCLLETIMTRAGFIGVPSEWWHFDVPKAKTFPIYDIPFEQIKA